MHYSATPGNRISKRIFRALAVAERLAVVGDPQLRWLGQWLVDSLKCFPEIDPHACVLPVDTVQSVARTGAEWESFVREFAGKAGGDGFALQLARIGTELRLFNELQEAGAMASDCEAAEHVIGQRTLHVETLLSNIGVLVAMGDYGRLGPCAGTVVALGEALALRGHSLY